MHELVGGGQDSSHWQCIFAVCTQLPHPVLLYTNTYYPPLLSTVVSVVAAHLSALQGSRTCNHGCRYSDLTECMDSISLEELIMAVRRQSQGFSRGTSSYRGVTHHPSGINPSSSSLTSSASSSIKLLATCMHTAQHWSI